MKLIYRRRLLKLAKFLRKKVAPLSEKLTPDGYRIFSMNNYLTSLPDGSCPERASLDCGTSACAAGWATAVFNAVTYHDNHGHFHIDRRCPGGRQTAMGSIGLFFGIRSGVDRVDLFGATPRDAMQEAYIIEEFVKRHRPTRKRRRR